MCEHRKTNVDQTYLESRLKLALECLAVSDCYLLECDANERAITHRLGMYLQMLMPLWHVDCEYNRDGDLPKSIVAKISDAKTDNTDAVTVYPDIIVHQRGTNQNMLVIEVKKSNATQSAKLSELEKLKSYLEEPLSYSHAVLVVLKVGCADGPPYFIEWVSESL